jgi:DNA polymerase-3 subunit gamma/tau
MEYQVLARKWRPQIFADVVGQKHITQTLQSELIQDKTAHAYLFVGPRGIGKTSIARIFAKALNCKNTPAQEPCCNCESCIAIAEGNSLDLIEIDGASNNSVDDIRQLREEVLYSPTSSRFKIYIIDEVHMLSNQAWNALLKTIEEPPPHAKFLFATTEAHKVLPTVVSRCQRFDLQRITFKLITEQMKKIASAENVQISDAAIEVIARAADGGMRDAQSLLDQMIAFSSVDQSEISEEQALAIFGLTGVAEMEKLIFAITQNDRASLIGSIHLIARQGKNLEKLFEDILAFLRGIQICMIMNEPEKILEIGDDLLALYKKIAAGTNSMMIQKLLENLSPVGRMLHDALNKQVFLETILLKAMRISHAVEIETLIQRLNQLRKGDELIDLEKIPAVNQISQQSVPELPPTPSIKETVNPETRLQAETTDKISSPPVAPTPAEPLQPPAPVTPIPPQQQTVVVAPPPQLPSDALPADGGGESANLPSPTKAGKGDVTPVSAEKVVDDSDVTPSDVAPPENSVSPALPVQDSNITPSALAEDISDTKVNVQENKNDELLSVETLFSGSSISGAPSSTECVDRPPEFPEMPSPALPLTSSEPTPELHVLEHPKEAAPEKTNSSPNNILTPEALWHSAIEEMDHCQQPLLKAYMQEGRPDSFVNGELTVVYDEESEAMHISEIKKEKALIETCLRRISGNRQATLSIVEKKVFYRLMKLYIRIQKTLKQYKNEQKIILL